MMKKVLFWDPTIYDMKHGLVFGGIAVQLNLWAQMFIKNGWEVHALSTEISSDEVLSEGIIYHRINFHQKFDVLLEWLNINTLFKHVWPDLVISRGAGRKLYPLTILSGRMGITNVFFGASDVNFVPGKSTVRNPLNLFLYERALKKGKMHIVSQNDYQAQTLKQNYGRDSLVLPNIWQQQDEHGRSGSDRKLYDVIWVSNFRRLKRAEWVINAAQKLPQFRFAIIGAPNDRAYYIEMEARAAGVSNLDFLGQQSFEKTSDLIFRSKVLICTSEYEGFPNTFLQAWSAGIPVVSTVDPNNIISRNSVGLTIGKQDELCSCLLSLLTDDQLYHQLAENVHNYFSTSHSAEVAFNKLQDFLACPK